MLNTDAERNGAGHRRAAGAVDLRARRDRGPVPALPDRRGRGGRHLHHPAVRRRVACCPTLLTTTNEQSSLTGGYQPYQPAPLDHDVRDHGLARARAAGRCASTPRSTSPPTSPAPTSTRPWTTAAGLGHQHRGARAAPWSASPTSTTSAPSATRSASSRPRPAPPSRPRCCPSCSSPSPSSCGCSWRPARSGCPSSRWPRCAASRRARLWVLGLSEPLVVLAVSAPVGAALGLGMGYGADAGLAGRRGCPCPCRG